MGCNCGKKKSVVQPKQQISKNISNKTNDSNNPNPRLIRRKLG